jgi:hypothetical protein
VAHPQAAPGSAELAVLLLCARTTLTDEQQARIRAHLQEDVSWPVLIRLATAHGLLPLLWQHVAAHFADSVPAAQQAHMRAYMVDNVRNNLLMLKELRELLTLLNGHGIPVIPYKGLALAHLLYPDIHLRESADIDLFVHEADLERAVEALTAHDYSLSAPGPDVRDYRRYAYHYSLRRARSGRLVELHWRFVRDHAILRPDDRWPWGRLQPLHTPALAMLSFRPEDYLLLLCAHGAKHWWKQLSHLCDVAEFVRTQSVDWAEVEGSARRQGARVMLHLGLLLAADLLQAPVPARVLAAAGADAAARSLAAAVAASLWAHGYLSERFVGHAAVTANLRLRERPRDKALWLFRQVWFAEANDDDLAQMSSGSARAFVYRGRRIARLLVTYGLGWLRGQRTP